MREPHVESLEYCVTSHDHTSYNNAPPMGFENDVAKFAIESSRLLVTPLKHFDSESSARAEIEPFLKSWEILSDVTDNIGAIRFKFDRANMIDLNLPKAGESVILDVQSTSQIQFSSNATLHLSRSHYPVPPSTFFATPTVLTAHNRYLQYKEGKEPLPSMAYYFYTLLVKITGGSTSVSRELNIDKQVVRKLSELSSTRGGENIARKAQSSGELTPQESIWLEAAVRKLIKQIGLFSDRDPLPKLSMSDLPKLDAF